jgi:hypothetical protein
MRDSVSCLALQVDRWGCRRFAFGRRRDFLVRFWTGHSHNGHSTTLSHVDIQHNNGTYVDIQHGNLSAVDECGHLGGPYS